MATVESYTKDYMQPILDAVVVGAHLEPDGDLILEHQDGSESPGGNILVPLSTIYPIGSVYLSVVNTNPGTLFGGTWVAFGAGRMPIGVDDGGDSRWNTAEEIGGTETISAAMLPTHTHAIGGSTGADAAHTHAAGSLDAAAEAAHTHGVGTYATAVEAQDHTHNINVLHLSAGVPAGSSENNGNSVAQGPTSGRWEHNVSTTGSSLSGRTAAHTHGLSGSSAAGASHDHAISGTTAAGSSHSHSLPANTGNNAAPTDVLRPPFISVYMWKRTA